MIEKFALTCPIIAGKYEQPICRGTQYCAYLRHLPESAEMQFIGKRKELADFSRAAVGAPVQLAQGVLERPVPFTATDDLLTDVRGMLT